MKKQFSGCVKFSIKGKKLYEFINALRKKRLNCYNQYCKNDTYYGEVSYSDIDIVESLAKSYNMEFDSFEYETIRKKTRRYKHRYGLFIGVFILILAIIYFSNTVFTIEINGNKNVSKATILTVLNEAGIKEGALINSINFTSCERKLRINIDGISWAGIRNNGNKIIVDITELVEKPDMLQERMSCNIIASKDAQITNVSVYEGQLMRIIGDNVRSGDILISGVTTDEYGHTSLHHSNGSITGIYEDSLTFSQDFIVERFINTDNIKKENYFNLFHFKIPLFIEKNQFSIYDQQDSSSSFSLFGKTLPLGITTATITEQEYSVVQYTKEEAELNIQEKIFLYEKNFLSNVKILERKLDYVETDMGLSCNVKYTLEGEIGISKEIYAK